MRRLRRGGERAVRFTDVESIIFPIRLRVDYQLDYRPIGSPASRPVVA